MIKQDNAAGRLHKLLVSAKTNPPDTPMRKVWAQTFGVSEENLPEIYSNLVRLQDALSSVERDIQLQDVDHEIYLQHFPVVRQLLALPNLETRLDRCIALFSEAMLMTLQFCSERLSKACPEKVPSDNDIHELTKELQSLFSRFQTADLPKALKAILMDLLEAMRQSLVEYQIRGGSGLRQELFFILERLQRTLPLLEQNKEKPEVRDFWSLLTKYDTLSSICVNAPPVIAGFQKAMTAIGMG